MSGHNRWSKIKRQKAAMGATKGKLFTKIIKEITVAARMGGGDEGGNFRLRAAVGAAREANMSREQIDRAIKKGTGELEGASYEEVTYEGYAPGGWRWWWSASPTTATGPPARCAPPSPRAAATWAPPAR